ncbi:alpha/beta-Hydrolase [Glarea lozoyensis ATCC 20868]|uniref:Alpha/beta-Hydrolase n=1 Tax=Glarea lozoyensis (strain ATCC 20868 / MF5171) TaxID=1116229 RepID=S3DHG2_GLAL2|nr:alpha/beta-Hydrolase [Glarea lozoyensis ATCC 20868]EPE37135.1 alpha/beta-Hydrolase [Glarea lozoyensis ATCC 20868]
MHTFTLTLLSLLPFSLASTHSRPNDSGSFSSLTQSYYPPTADCIDHLIPVPITSSNFFFNFTKWTSDLELTDFLSIATTRPSAGFPGVLEPPTAPETATFEIAASFCTPKIKNGKEKTVIFATHGIGPARAHWNSPWRPEEFNFVQAAVAEGYSVFFYDRLGCGASQKISGFKNQLSIATSIIQVLTSFVRAGQYTGDIKAEKIAHIGFSFGALATHGAISMTPEISDAVILTAIGFNSSGLNVNGLARSFVPRIAALQNPRLYGDRDNGMVTWVDKFAQVQNYFKKPNFDEATIDFVEAAKEPFAITEFLTLLTGPTDASNFTKPALHISGEQDYIFCDGLCTGIFEEPARTIYKNANPLQLTLHPGASHNINFHHNATGAYRVITDFLKNNGL